MTNNEGAGQMSERVDLDGIEARATDEQLDSWASGIHDLTSEQAQALVAEVRVLRAKVEAVEAVATLFDERDNGALSYAAWKVRGALHSGERVS